MQARRRLALVTGSNRGIGHAIAKGLVEAGFEVLATSRGEAEGRPAAGEIGARFQRLDVTDPSSIEALKTSFGGDLDVLVNNAGVALDGFDSAVVEKTIAVNYRGPVRVTEALLPRLSKGGRILMISSSIGVLSSVGEQHRKRLLSASLDRAAIDAFLAEFADGVKNGDHEKRGYPSSAYGVSKIALNAYVRVLSKELEDDPRGITVNAICPGWVRTRMGGKAAPRSVEEGADTPVWLATLDESPTGGFYRDRATTAW